ncbi:hypothetical protein [Jeotgalibacillus campisalis]|uniref:hypothetical protein n=1 Tax=Jeotgalibacillus campisalis TaxID=220754 RepID=UPI000596C636|nr:hypothetical protein [Jeotgalibacillus campisalis]
MSIRIGNNNKIKNSSIGHKYSSNGVESDSSSKEKFHKKHPVLFNLLISLVGGFLLLFSFWESLVIWLESFLKR